MNNESNPSLIAELEEIKVKQKRLDEAFRISVREGTETLVVEAERLGKELGADIVALKEKLRQADWLKYEPRYLEQVERKKDYKVKETLEGHSGPVSTLQVLPDGRIVSGSDDQTIKIWEKNQAGKYKEKETLEGHTGAVRTIQVLPDGWIVSGSYDKTIKIWDGEKE